MYQSSGNEKEGCCLFFPSSTKREIWHFHVVVVQRRQEMYKKSMMHKVLFDQSKTIAFLPFSRTSPSSLLKLPIDGGWGGGGGRVYLATEGERHLTTGKRAKRTKLDLRFPISRPAIGQASCLICARRRSVANNGTTTTRPVDGC